jgi:hypothetical protein
MQKHLEDISEADCGPGDLPNRSRSAATAKGGAEFMTHICLPQSQEGSNQSSTMHPCHPALGKKHGEYSKQVHYSKVYQILGPTRVGLSFSGLPF